MIIDTSDGSWFYMTINADIVALAEREYLPEALAGNSTAAKYLLWVLFDLAEIHDLVKACKVCRNET